jgi:Type IV secretion system pilin
MQRIKLAIIALAAVVMPMLFLSTPVLADNGQCRNSFFGAPTWYKYLPLDSDCGIATNDANGNLKIDGSVVLLITLAIIEILLFIAGFLAGFIIIYGAFKFITSQGEPGKVASARTTIANAIVGLLIAVIASRVVSFIGGKLAEKAASSSGNGVLGNANIPNVAASGNNLADILSFVFALAGAIALLVITIAGFRFVISQGDPQKVATARQTILYAVVGLVIAILSFTIFKFVLVRV